IRIVVEDARPGIILPVIIAVQRGGPVRRDRDRIVGREGNGEWRRIRQFVAAQVLRETCSAVRCGVGIKAVIYDAAAAWRGNGEGITRIRYRAEIVDRIVRV